VDAGVATVKGPNGTMSASSPTHHARAVGDVLTVSRVNDETQYRSLHGLTRTLIANMVVGVTDGWSKELEIIGVGYRAPTGDRACSTSRWASRTPSSSTRRRITFEVPVPTRVIVKGADKEVVGQVAASIRKIRKPSPTRARAFATSENE